MEISNFSFFAAMTLLLAATPAQAWGTEGHEVVAHIAAQELSPRARAQVSALLGGEAEAMMALEANWADEIRDDRPQTSSWHFVNIEIGDVHYVPARDCPQDNCVVAQIGRDEDLLRSRASPGRKAEALKFLIHFVGDIHQPLHAGENHDRGGNDVMVRWGDRRTNLHHIWDDDVVAVQGPDPRLVAQDIVAGISPRQAAGWRQGGAADWAVESALIARQVIYAPLNGAETVRLDGRYARSQAPVARAQLAEAGVRLAMLLNRIFR